MKKYLLILALMIGVSPAHAGSSNADLMNMYQGYASDTLAKLDTPHRSATELGVWLSDRVADALLFAPRDTNRKLTSLRPYFSDQGYSAYLAFLAAHGYGDKLKAQTLNLSAIVNNEPMLIGQGASAGRYAWAFEMPVVISGDGTNKSMVLRIQLGRSAKAQPPMGVWIENWQEFKEPAEAAPTESGGQVP